ncbi:MAG: hypothetical protein COT73_09515 [Bdellovibrio sp. CG10_big_fil_rev_8_21_14_0_10_47_8]|nr:MAG: hypothetical protein COT73_09515 [Bdellovibrio sp. CG10_big_fil_rev_8_21_14_0_10_47_8]
MKPILMAALLITASLFSTSRSHAADLFVIIEGEDAVAAYEAMTDAKNITSELNNLVSREGRGITCWAHTNSGTPEDHRCLVRVGPQGLFDQPTVSNAK